MACVQVGGPVVGVRGQQLLENPPRLGVLAAVPVLEGERVAGKGIVRSRRDEAAELLDARTSHRCLGGPQAGNRARAGPARSGAPSSARIRFWASTRTTVGFQARASASSTPSAKVARMTTSPG